MPKVLSVRDFGIGGRCPIPNLMRYTILDGFCSGEAKAVMVEYGPQVLREVDMFQDEGFRSFW